MSNSRVGSSNLLVGSHFRMIAGGDPSLPASGTSLGRTGPSCPASDTSLGPSMAASDASGMRDESEAEAPPALPPAPATLGRESPSDPPPEVPASNDPASRRSREPPVAPSEPSALTSPKLR